MYTLFNQKYIIFPILTILNFLIKLKSSFVYTLQRARHEKVVYYHRSTTVVVTTRDVLYYVVVLAFLHKT